MVIVFEKKTLMFQMPEHIDESTDFGLFETAEAPLNLDFSAMKSLNSYGIRGLIGAIRSLEPREFFFFNCPVHFVTIFNVIKALLGTTESGKCVKYFYAPYSNEDCAICCGETQDLLIDVSQMRELAFPESSCQKCSKALDPEEIAEDYLGFLLK